MRCQAHISWVWWTPWWATQVPLQAGAAAAQSALGRQSSLISSFRTCLSCRELPSPRSQASLSDESSWPYNGWAKSAQCRTALMGRFDVRLSLWGRLRLALDLCGSSTFPSAQSCFLPLSRGLSQAPSLKKSLHVQLCLRGYFEEKPTHESDEG